jgi:hypothetical protein
MQNPDTKVADRDRLAILDPHIDERGATVMMHEDRRAKAGAQRACGGEVVGMRMGVDDMPDPQLVRRRERRVAVSEIE